MTDTNNEIEQAVVDAIKHHVGKDSAITAKEISREAGLDQFGTCPTTRKLIRRIIRNRQLPVASCTNGYYIAETSDEAMEYVESLEYRIAGIESRKNEFLDAYMVETLNQ